MTIPYPLPSILDLDCPGPELIDLSVKLKAYDSSHQTVSKIIALRRGRQNADWTATVSSRPIPLKQASLL